MATIAGGPEGETKMPRKYRTLILGASYGSLLATKLGLAGHSSHLICLPAEADLAVMGQYGHETWDSRGRSFTSPEPPAGLQAFRDELPDLLAAEHAEEAHVEEKGLAIAVHTRPSSSCDYERSSS